MVPHLSVFSILIACYKTVNAIVAASFFFPILSTYISFRTVISQTDEISCFCLSCLQTIRLKNGSADESQSSTEVT